MYLVQISGGYASLSYSHSNRVRKTIRKHEAEVQLSSSAPFRSVPLGSDLAIYCLAATATALCVCTVTPHHTAPRHNTFALQRGAVRYSIGDRVRDTIAIVITIRLHHH